MKKNAMKTTNQKKEGINMTKNATKTIFMTTLAGTTFVGGMVSNITPILAEENKQETLVEKSSSITEEEQLMNAIHAAQNEIEQASQSVSEKETVSKQAEVLKIKRSRLYNRLKNRSIKNQMRFLAKHKVNWKQF